jgi:hypothetical protein
MAEQRTALRSSLLAKAGSLSECLPDKLFTVGTDKAIGTADVSTEEDESIKMVAFKKINQDVLAFDDAVSELKKWVDSGDVLKDDAEKDALALTLMRHELARSRPGDSC